VFTRDCDSWDAEDFATRIYNSSYIEVDPEYTGARARANLGYTLSNLRGRGLDYGCGNGMLGKLVRSAGYLDFKGYDPYSSYNKRPSGLFNTIYCYEVFEHTCWPQDTLADILSFAAPECTIHFTTLVDGTDSYIAPRNGHITIHTAESLRRLGSGLKYVQINAVTHIYVKN
jgi:2-polyprenyl-6-hydroxyphenyl methylase/3-demethylubiquinone-9 3-methyltransferase